MNQDDDLKGVRDQLVAIVDWLGDIDRRLTLHHACLGTKQLRQAQCRLADLQLQVAKVVEEQCKKEPS